MRIYQQKILEKHCYTILAYQRINKKLNTHFSNAKIEALVKRLLQQTALENWIQKGKNFYITNQQEGIRITINSNTFSVITVDSIKK